MKRAVDLALAASLALFVAVSALGMTADGILERVEQEGLLGFGQTNLHAEFSVELRERDQEPTEYGFRVWSQEGVDETTRALIEYSFPDDVAGMLFLIHTPPEGDARLWLYMPELALVRELLGTAAREGEFIAGSGISYREVAEGLAYRGDYSAELVGEEELDGVACWRLALTPKKPAEAEWTKIHLWVHAQAYFVMRADFVGGAGVVDRRIIASEIDEDELGLFPRLMSVEDLAEGRSAKVRIAARSGAEVPEAYFVPENLPALEL